MTADSATSEQISRAESVGSAALWFGLVGAPAAWGLHLVVSYSLEEWFACSPSVAEPGEVAGVGVRSAALLITAVGALIALAAGLAAASCFRKTKGNEEGARRARWMAVAGLMNSALYLLMIVAGSAAPLILEVCENSP